MAVLREVAVAATEPTVFHARRRTRIPLRSLSWMVAGIGAFGVRPALAQSTLDFRFLNYQESDGRTQVQEPMLMLHQDLGASLGMIDLTLVHDVISGASPTGAYPTVSVTTTTGASGGSSTTAAGHVPLAPDTDNRKAAFLSYSRKFGAHLPSVEISNSTEHDYVSHEFGLSDAWTLLEGRGTLHYGGSISNDMVDPVTNHLHLSKTSRSIALGWTWIIGEDDLVDLSATLTKLHGYLDEPYKIVPVGTGTVPDHRPDSRFRQAYLLKYGHYFDWDGALKGSYRFYKDDWDIRAHTLDFTYDQHVDEDWVISPRLRWYSQNGASFYGGSFAQPQTYLSADYRLSPFDSLLFGLNISYDVTSSLTLNAGASTQQSNGHDRLKPISTTGGSSGVDASPADFSTNTFTFGFKWRF